MVSVALTREERLGILGGGREDDGRGHGFLLEAWSSFLADLPCAVFLVDRGHVAGADPLKEGERLLKKRRLRVLAPEVIVGVFGLDGLDLPREAEAVAEDDESALQVNGRL